MKCGWSKLDKIDTDCEKVNLKNVGPYFREGFSIFGRALYQNFTVIVKYPLRFHVSLHKRRY